MKKVLSLLFAFCFVITALFAVTACDEDSNEKAEAPIKFSYSLVKEDDDTYYSLKSVTISEEAKKLADKNDYTKLAELFNTAVEGYEAPATAYTKDTVRVLAIPATYNNKAVKAISAEAISGLGFIKELIVGENIEKIAEGAFSSLNSLEKITLPFVGGEYNAKNEKKLFGYIFGTTSGDELTACEQKYNGGDSGNTKTYQVPTSLKTVVVTKGNDKKTETLKYKIDDGKYVFEGDEGYADIDAEENTVTEDKSEYAVAPYSFYGCATIETFSFAGITEIEPFTFYGCTSIKTLSFADEITAIGESAFEGCSSLKSLDLNNVTKIGKAAFKDCISLGGDYINQANTVAIPATVTEIGESAFEGCTSIKTVDFGGATIIGKYAFKGLTSLKAVSFSAVEIGYASFYGCTEITAIDLTNVVSISDYAFYGCSKLESLANPNALNAPHAFDETNIDD